MSAYLCNPEHIAALAAYAGSPRDIYNSIIHDWRIGNNRQNVENCARELAMANIASVAAHYPDDVSGGRPGPSMTDEEYIEACGRIARKYETHKPGLKPVDIIKMCGGYEYQSCEADTWANSLACRQIEWILSKAHRALPGYDDATRDFHDPNAYA